MDKFVKDGAIFSTVFLVLAILLNLLLMTCWTSARNCVTGFPLIFEEYSQFNAINFSLDFLLPIVLGFGASYIKNKVKK